MEYRSNLRLPSSSAFFSQITPKQNSFLAGMRGVERSVSYPSGLQIGHVFSSPAHRLLYPLRHQARRGLDRISEGVADLRNSKQILLDIAVDVNCLLIFYI